MTPIEVRDSTSSDGDVTPVPATPYDDPSTSAGVQQQLTTDFQQTDRQRRSVRRRRERELADLLPSSSSSSEEREVAPHRHPLSGKNAK